MALDKIRTELIADDAVTAAKIPTGAIGTTEIAEGALSVHALQNTTSHTLSGTYSDSKMYTSDAYVLGGDITVNSNLVLSSVKGDSSDITLTDDGTTRTITGTGKLEGGAILAKEKTDLTGMTGELGSAVTGTPAITGFGTVTSGTLGSGVTFPALHGIVGTSGCHVYLTSVTSATGSASTKIAFDTVTYDIASEFASNKFTVTTAGYYYIHVSVGIQDFADMKAMQARIYKNGSLVQFSRNNNGRTDHLVDSVTTVLYLSANDYIEGYVYNGWSTTKNTTAGSNNDTFMTIMRWT